MLYLFFNLEHIQQVNLIFVLLSWSNVFIGWAQDKIQEFFSN